MGIIEEMRAEIEELKKRVEELETKQRVRKSFTEYREIKTQKNLVNLQQKQRDRIIEKAKNELEEIISTGGENLDIPYFFKEVLWAPGCLEFKVNRESRLVFANIKERKTGSVYSTGLAICHPDDCFNVYIGKLIALYRALRLEIPYEYWNVPQPTEIRIGDVVRNKNTGLIYEVVRENRKFFIGKEKEFEIIDDSREKGD